MADPDAGERQIVHRLREARHDRGLLRRRHLPPAFDLQTLDLGRRIQAQGHRRHRRIIATSRRAALLVDQGSDDTALAGPCSTVTGEPCSVTIQPFANPCAGTILRSPKRPTGRLRSSVFFQQLS